MAGKTYYRRRGVAQHGQLSSRIDVVDVRRGDDRRNHRQFSNLTYETMADNFSFVARSFWHGLLFDQVV